MRIVGLCLAFLPSLLRAQADSIAPDATSMSTQTATDFAKGMWAGWNVGNSLEATGGETNWGNPKITQVLIDSVKAAGFNAIRIPVAWSKFSDPTTFKIDTVWAARVQQVVNYVTGRGMYAVLNMHWDGGWMQPTYAQQAYVDNRMQKMWKQIAVRFRNANDHLLFAGTNEVMVTNKFSAPTAEYLAVQNGFNQIFVNTVRSTGGRNAYRYLVVQTFNTNIDYGVSGMKIPMDVSKNRLMVEVHYYDPYDFALNGGSAITQWGATATDASKVEAWGNEAHVDAQFGSMKTNFGAKGYPVILGEYGVIARTDVPDQAKYRVAWMKYVTGAAVKNAIIPFYWDNGGTGSMGIFNRSNGTRSYPTVIQAIISQTGTGSTALAHSANALRTTTARWSNGNLIINRSGSEPTRATLLDIQGRPVRNLDVVPGSRAYAVGKLVAGLYIIRVPGEAPIEFLAQ